MSRTIHEYVESLPRSAVWFRVCVGTTKEKVTVGFVALSSSKEAVQSAETKADEEGVSVETCARRDLVETLLRMAEDNGYPEDEPTVRIHAYQKEGKAGRTYQRTDKSPRKASKGQTSSEGALADALVRMADRVGYVVEIQNGIIESLGAQVVQLSTERMDLQRQVVDKEADLLDAQLEAVIESIRASSDTDDQLRSQVQTVIQRLGSFFLGDEEEPPAAPPEPPPEGS